MPPAGLLIPPRQSIQGVGGPDVYWRWKTSTAHSYPGNGSAGHLAELGPGADIACDTRARRCLPGYRGPGGGLDSQAGASRVVGGIPPSKVVLVPGGGAFPTSRRHRPSDNGIYFLVKYLYGLLPRQRDRRCTAPVGHTRRLAVDKRSDDCRADSLPGPVCDRANNAQLVSHLTGTQGAGRWCHAVEACDGHWADLDSQRVGGSGPSRTGLPWSAWRSFIVRSRCRNQADPWCLHNDIRSADSMMRKSAPPCQLPLARRSRLIDALETNALKPGDERRSPLFPPKVGPGCRDRSAGGPSLPADLQPWHTGRAGQLRGERPAEIVGHHIFPLQRQGASCTLSRDSSVLPR